MASRNALLRPRTEPDNAQNQRRGIFGSRRGDNTNRRFFKPCLNGLTHAGTKGLVHVEVSLAAVRQAWMDFVVVNHFAMGV